jgi:hypothetical protein
MKFPTPRSLRGQTILVILSGLLASNAVGALIYSIDRRDVIASTEALDLADRVAGVIELVRKLPAGWSNDIIRVSNSRTFRLFVSQTPTVAKTDDHQLAADIARDLRAQLHGTPERPIQVALSTGSDLDRLESSVGTGALARAATIADGVTSHTIVNFSVQLDNGRWLNFSGILPKDKIPLARLGRHLRPVGAPGRFCRGLVACHPCNQAADDLRPRRRSARQEHSLGSVA